MNADRKPCDGERGFYRKAPAHLPPADINKREVDQDDQHRNIEVRGGIHEERNSGNAAVEVIVREQETFEADRGTSESHQDQNNRPHLHAIEHLFNAKCFGENSFGYSLHVAQIQIPLKVGKKDGFQVLKSKKAARMQPF
jgi:hypothetical protein